MKRAIHFILHRKGLEKTMMEQYSKWIEIDAETVRQNVAAIRSKLNSRTALMAVIKNNAYGHGLIETASFLSGLGISRWAVTWAEEAVSLRKAGIAGEILLLAPASTPQETALAIENHATLCAASLKDIQVICQTAGELGIKTQIHIKIETGLSRFGFTKPSDLQAAAAQILNCPEAEATGAFTHMADAANKSSTKKQFNRFLQSVEILKNAGITPACLHCANSGVFLKYPEMHLDMVRLGTLLCGQYPAGNYEHSLPIKDPFHYKTRIHSIRPMPAGSLLGYKSTWKLRAPAQIAVIPTGYSDGLALTVNNRAENLVDVGKKMLKPLLNYMGISRFQTKVKVQGIWYPIRGKVFMQMALVEFPMDAPVQCGTDIEVPISKTLAAKEIPHIFVETSPRTSALPAAPGS